MAHLELSYRLGRRVTLAEFGELIAKESGRDLPFTAAAVSRWESGLQIPNPDIIEAIGRLTGIDPGWLSHGDKTAAPAPRLPKREPEPEPVARSTDADVQEVRSKEAEGSAELEGIKIVEKERPNQQ